MALTVAYSSQLGINFLRSPGMAVVTVTTGGASYATASGGLVIDLTTLLTAGATGLPVGLNFAGMPAFGIGASALGHLAVFTKTSTSGQFTMRLWNGTTEIGDGAVTQTVTAIFFFD